MLFGIALLACYFAVARDLSLGKHVLAIGGMLLYWFCPLGVLMEFLGGWGGVAAGLAVAGGFVIYNSTRSSAGDPETPLSAESGNPKRGTSRAS